MIQLYTWKTPNGRKPAIMLEEVGLPYRVHAVDLTKDQQLEPSFLAISPNNKIPAIVDEEEGREGPLFESGAILSYLAEKSGMLLPPPGPGRWFGVRMAILVDRRLRPDAGPAQLLRRPIERQGATRD